MTGHDAAPAPMALDDPSLADSGQVGGAVPVDLETLDAAGGAPAPAALSLIGDHAEVAPSPDPAMGGEVVVRAGVGDAPAPQLFGGESEAATTADEPPRPMSIDELDALSGQ